MYVFSLMTSWAMVCEVYYLKPTTIQVCTVLELTLSQTLTVKHTINYKTTPLLSNLLSE